MGQQVNFVATAADFAELHQRLGKRESMLLLSSRSPSSAPQVLTAFDDRAPLYYFVREPDVGAVVTAHVRAGDYWGIDVERSPVVEVHRSASPDGSPGPGRIYYTDGWYGDDGAWIEKPAKFQSWARGSISATRKMLTRRDGEYVGPDALRWQERAKPPGG